MIWNHNWIWYAIWISMKYSINGWNFETSDNRRSDKLKRRKEKIQFIEEKPEIADACNMFKLKNSKKKYRKRPLIQLVISVLMLCISANCTIIIVEDAKGKKNSFYQISIFVFKILSSDQIRLIIVYLFIFFLFTKAPQNRMIMGTQQSKQIIFIKEFYYRSLYSVQLIDFGWFVLSNCAFIHTISDVMNLHILNGGVYSRYGILWIVLKNSFPMNGTISEI